MYIYIDKSIVEEVYKPTKLNLGPTCRVVSSLSIHAPISADSQYPSDRPPKGSQHRGRDAPRHAASGAIALRKQSSLVQRMGRCSRNGGFNGSFAAQQKKSR